MVKANLPVGANPGAASERVIYDDGAQPGYSSVVRHARRCTVVSYLDQSYSLIVRWQSPGGVLRTYETIALAASTVERTDVLLLPGRTQIVIATGTAPTVWEVAAELDDQRDAGV